MSRSPVTVQALTPDDWQRYRAVRLEALRDAPRAFGSTLERELDYDEPTWRDRARTAALAVRDGVDVGIVAWFDAPHLPEDARYLVAMWVDPAHRGTGVARPLVEWVLELARATPGKRRVFLDVATWNDTARRLYERCGFERTGRQGYLPSFPDVLEDEMVIDLRG